MTSHPMFSVIVTDYDASVPREQFKRKMACLAAQTCKDFEVLVYHDGPKAISYAEEMRDMPMHPASRFIVTEARQNDWGHSNRDRGMREAAGEWIIHTNADNVFYPDLIAKLKEAATSGTPCFIAKYRKFPIIIKSIVKRLDRYVGTDIAHRTLVEVDYADVMIYAIRMQGLLAGGAMLSAAKH